MYKGTFRLAFACAIGSTGSNLFIMRRLALLSLGMYREDHAIHTRLCEMDWWTSTDLQRMHVRAYAAARTRNRFDHDAVHCMLHSAYPMLTITKAPGVKIEFVGTIRICGLPTPFALEDGAFVSG